MVQSSWEANGSSGGKVIPRILWNPKVHYHIHKSPLTVPNPSHTNHVHVHPNQTSWRSIINCILPCMLRSSKWSLSLYAPPLSHISAKCPAHHILGLITRIILGEEYGSQSSSICSVLHSPVNSSLFGPNILLSHPFSNTLGLSSSLQVRYPVSHPLKTRRKIKVLYTNVYILR